MAAPIKPRDVKVRNSLRDFAMSKSTSACR